MCNFQLQDLLCKITTSFLCAQGEPQLFANTLHQAKLFTLCVLVLAVDVGDDKFNL